MKNKLVSGLALAAFLGGMSAAAVAQNVAIVNGKAVPLARVEALSQQVERTGRPVTPEVQQQIKDEVIAREVFMQEAQKQGIDRTAEFKNQMELARQAILIRELFATTKKLIRSQTPKSRPNTTSLPPPTVVRNTAPAISW